MKFNKIAFVSPTRLANWATTELQKYSDEEIIAYPDFPATPEELVKRIGKADCVFVSWETHVTKEVIEECPNLKYIGMCCSLYDEATSNIDFQYARKKDIKVTGVRDYGDEGLIEFILSELIRLVKGLGANQWKDTPVELTNRRLGIVGMGATGQMLAKAAMAFRMNISYYSRNRKPDIEKMGVQYLPLKELLSSSEIISTHLPRNTELIDEKLFSSLGQGKILVNTSLSLTFDKASFSKWIEGENNFAIFDGCGVAGHLKEFERHPKIITTDKVAGITAEAIERLSQKVIDNFKSYTERGSSI